MKTKILIAVLCIGLFSISTVFAQEKEQAKTKHEHKENVTYACPMKCEGEKTYDEAGSCPKCNMDLKKVEKVTYACPMKCEGEKTYDEVGSCPKCNMDLKKVDKVAYACPMKCEGEKTYDKTGTCPKCNMDLKKVGMKMKK